MQFQKCNINQAAELIQNGELVAFPTETVYGLGASVFQPDAIRKIYTAKGRPQDNPLIVHISSLKQLPLIVKEIPEEFYLLAQNFFPGPLTIVLPKQEAVPDLVSASLPTIGVRMPAHPLARRLIERVGVPLVAPSANLSGKPSSTTAEHVWEDFGGKIGGILDGGPCQYGIESTVITLVPQPTILRPGSITQQQLERVLGRPFARACNHAEKPLSPGMKYRHYAPAAKIRLFDTQHALDVHLEKYPNQRRALISALEPADLYALFRKADADSQDEILILCTPSMRQNAALMNRLIRASES